MRSAFVAILSFIVACLSTALKADNDTSEITVRAALSDWKPYAYMEDGEIKGYAYEIAKMVFDRAEIPLLYEIWSWARVYRTGKEERNFMIGGLGRTPKRENLFHWIGPVTKGVDVSFHKRTTSEIIIKSLKDLEDYTVALRETPMLMITC